MPYVCYNKYRTTGYRLEAILCSWAWLTDGFCGEACMTDIIHSAGLIMTSAIRSYMSFYPVSRSAADCCVAYFTLVAQVKRLVRCVCVCLSVYVRTINGLWSRYLSCQFTWHYQYQIWTLSCYGDRRKHVFKVVTLWLLFLSFLCDISKAPVLRFSESTVLCP